MKNWVENEDPKVPLNVAFDVDGTLIHQVGEAEDTPKYEVIALFHFFEKRGNNMFIWSGGGFDYAERWSQKLGLKATIAVKGSFKPDIAVDDMNVNLGVVNIRV
jgi:predicted HAD superfamily phosphohydrolase YqeG